MTRPSTSIFGAGFVDLNADTAPKSRQVALVPGALVPVLPLDLPSGLRGEAREQVARRQVLDRMGLDDKAVEIRPFHGLKDKETWSHVLLADAASLARWRKLGQSCKAVLPDYLALPTADGVWSFAASADGVAMRFGPHDGFSATVDVACAMLRRKLRDSRPEKTVRVGPDVPAIETLLAGEDIAVSNDQTGLKSLSHSETSFDLRRDPRQARVRLRRKVLPWRWPALIGGVAAAVWAAAQIIETRTIETRSAALAAETRALVRTHFVPNGPILDVRSQVSRAIVNAQVAAGQGQSQITALTLFARASTVIADQSATIEAVTSATPRDVILVLRVADFAASDQLADALRAADLNVDVIESRVSDTTSGVRSELRVTAVAP
ncbi:type II secretion system protein GspL [Ascidiaceihabitans sp.]|uniref:type II secretion system protein GspL n=1 Tax=Ascidiaceihabitans sp. TaxID=1872644 RepID=UPI0032984273